jgi:DNA-binding MarR family transcriptional regulator
MDEDVYAVLRDYPRIYFACHVEHRTRGRSATGLTSRDAGLLAHVADGTAPSALARHLGVSRSTLSEALARLAAQDLVTVEVDSADQRRRCVRLTATGRQAVAASSVLDADRVGELLGRLSADERRRAVEGLGLLAEGARRAREG